MLCLVWLLGQTKHFNPYRLNVCIGNNKRHFRESLLEIINKTKLMACFGPYSNLSKNCRNIHFKMWIYVTCTKIVPYINKIVFGLSFTDSRPLKLRKSINFSKKTMISMDCYQLLSFFYISNKFSLLKILTNILGVP